VTLILDIVDRGMAQWLHERPDIDCSGKAIVGRILRLQDVILRAANSALKQHGLNYSAYAVLATLRASGAPYRMSPSQLVETLLLTSGGTSNLLARLERKGWIKRLADPLDGRAVIVELTPAGKVLVDGAMADHAAMERQLLEMLTQDEKVVLAELLSRMLVQNSSTARWIPAASERSETPAGP
jgi:DNA-binding MarR family transcriptional regulator